MQARGRGNGPLPRPATLSPVSAGIPGSGIPAPGEGPRPLERFLAARGDVELLVAELGAARIVLFDVDELAEAQIGYATGADDEDLTGDAPGQWRPLWLVAGEEEGTQLALLVDLADERLPVLAAAEDEHGWAPVELAPGYAAFAALLAELEALAAGGMPAQQLVERAAAAAAAGPAGGAAAAAARGIWETWLLP